MTARRSGPTRAPVQSGQESVWDYPRPPRLEPADGRIRVELAGVTVAETTSAYRVLETSHPPAYYVPPEDCAAELFEPAPRSSFCEWKGAARYESVRVGDTLAERAAWRYESPTKDFEAITDHRSFYPALVECRVDGVTVTPQPGGFYGGWITPDVIGPFKGEAGTEWW